MTGAIGTAAGWVALAALVAAVPVALRGRDRAAWWLHVAGAVAVGVALGALVWALATGGFTFRYVAATTDRVTSWPYRVAGLWGGMAGSLLLWSALLAAFGVLRRRAVTVERAVLAGAAAAFLAVDLVLAHPFETLASPALDGRGLTPILEHPAMLYHPPLLYLGLCSLVVPFALAAAGRVDEVRPWLLASWAVLAGGMLAGAHWAYVELGWGGYWAWDPVENTALLPWLAAGAALHALRGSGARAALALSGSAFVLAALGTTLTRSGATPSVHAFAEDDAVGLALVALTSALVVVLAAATLRSGGSSPEMHRTAAPRTIRLQPVLAMTAAGIVLAGTALPALRGGDVAVNGTYFARFVAPLAIAALALLLAAGLVRPSWRRPGLLAHAGFAVLLLGIAGTTFDSSASATLAPGETLDVGGWTVRNDGVRVEGDDRVVATVALARGGDHVATLHPALVAHPDRGQVLAETSLRSTPWQDVQVILRDAGDDGRALLVVHVRPLTMLVWWGGLLLTFAGGVAATRAIRASSRAASRASPAAEPAPVAAGAP